jgi:hypothetical protein
MTCGKTDIKELLPAYLEHGFDKVEQARIDQHLKSCEDCREELSLLRMMAEDAVPDPGEAFWAEMPDGIYREVRRLKQRKKPASLSDVLGGLFIPRWAWAAAAVAVVAVAGFLLYRPATVELTALAPMGGEAPYEDIVSAEPMDIAELDERELDMVATWVDKEFAAISDEVATYTTSGGNGDIEDEFANLDAKQLERLSKMLNAGKREV